jgi:hypothetical protein
MLGLSIAKLVADDDVYVRKPSNLYEAYVVLAKRLLFVSIFAIIAMAYIVPTVSFLSHYVNKYIILSTLSPLQAFSACAICFKFREDSGDPHNDEHIGHTILFSIPVLLFLWFVMGIFFPTIDAAFMAAYILLTLLIPLIREGMND